MSGDERDPDAPDLSRIAERIRGRSGGDRRRRRRPTSGAELDETRELGAEPLAIASEPTTGPAQQPPGPWQRYDLWVVLAALAVFAAGTLTHRSLTAPVTAPLARAGLVLDRPAGWLSRPVAPPPSPLATAIGRDRAPRAPTAAAAALPYHVVFTSPRDPVDRLEVRIERRPAYDHLRGALALQRVARYGEHHWSAEVGNRSLGGRDWARTRFRYAYQSSKGDSPRIATGVEYALVSGTLLFVVTFHGTDASAVALEALVAPTLEIDANAPAALDPTP